MGKNNDNYLVQGSILAAAGIIVRLIGLFYKVPMTRILGMRASVITIRPMRSTILA